jgi:hypothetical protein
MFVSRIVTLATALRVPMRAFCWPNGSGQTLNLCNALDSTGTGAPCKEESGGATDTTPSDTESA